MKITTTIAGAGLLTFVVAGCGLSAESAAACEAGRNVARKMADDSYRLATFSLKQDMTGPLAKELTSRAEKAGSDIRDAINAQAAAIVELREVLGSSQGQDAVKAANEKLDRAGARVMEVCPE